MQKKLADYNNKPFQKIPGSRSSVFLAEEKQAEAAYWQSGGARVSRKIIKIEACRKYLKQILQMPIKDVWQHMLVFLLRVTSSFSALKLKIDYHVLTHN